MSDDDRKREALERLSDAEPWQSVGTLLSQEIDDASLRCPSCADAVGLHLCGVRTLDAKAGKLTERIRDGVFPFARPDAVAGLRGAQLEVGLFCEACGRATVLGLQFHKGTIYVRWKHAIAAGEPNDIWRD